MPCPKKVQKKYKKGKIETDKRRKHFFHTFLYLLGEWTNQCYVPRHSVVPKHQIVKSVLSVRRHYPKRDRSVHRKPEYLSLFTGSKFATPKFFYFWRDRFSLATLHFIIFLFLILTGWMRGALCVATHLYILYLAADESISGWEFFLLIPKSPQYIATRKAELGGFLEKKWIFVRLSRFPLKFFKLKKIFFFFFFFFFLVCPANPLFFFFSFLQKD